MNREIKFRGYNAKNKKWIYGYYLVNRGEHFICDDGLQPPTATWEDFLVAPESIGQFTGMKTKGSLLKPEQKDIYEDDILRIPQNMFHIEIIGRVIFDAGRFRVKSRLSGSMCDLELAIADGAEIIGNVHDNPELWGKGVTDEE